MLHLPLTKEYNSKEVPTQAELERRRKVKRYQARLEKQKRKQLDEIDSFLD